MTNLRQRFSPAHIGLLTLSGLLMLAILIGLTHTSGTACGQPILGRYALPYFVVLASLGAAGLAGLIMGLLLNRAQVQNILIAAVGIGLAFVLLEVAARLKPILPSVDNFWLESNPLTGVWYRPDTTFQMGDARREFQNEYHIDSQGLIVRGDHRPPAEGDRRIMLIGDSFLAGLEVPADDNLSVRLDTYLAEQQPGTSTHIANYGMPTFSPAKYLLVYRSFAPDYRPDLVIVLVYVGNDFTDDASLFNDNRLEFDSDGMLTGVVPELDMERRTLWRAQQGNQPIPFREDLSIWDSRLRLLVWQKVVDPICHARQGREYIRAQDSYSQEDHRAFIEQQEIRISSFGIFKQGPFTPADQVDIARTLGYLHQLHTEVTADGAELRLVIVPLREQVREGMPNQQIDSRRPQEILAEFCADEGIACLDLISYFEEHAEAPIFFASNIHFVSYGHDLTAQAIAEWLTAAP